MTKLSRYHYLTAAEKQRVVRESVREPPVVCPGCSTSVQPADLVAHVRERCEGQREPHPRSRWVTWSQALELGAPPWTITRWVQRGLVRVRGERFDRQYLLRDLALRLADRRPSVEQPRKLQMRNFRRKGWLR